MGYKDRRDMDQWRDEYLKVLNLKTALSELYESAINKSNKLTQAGVKPPVPPTPNLEEEAKDLGKQKDKAVSALKGIVSKPEALKFLDDIRDPEEIKIFNLYVASFKKDIEGIPVGTADNLSQLWSNYRLKQMSGDKSHLLVGTELEKFKEILRKRADDVIDLAYVNMKESDAELVIKEAEDAVKRNDLNRLDALMAKLLFEKAPPREIKLERADELTSQENDIIDIAGEVLFYERIATYYQKPFVLSKYNSNMAKLRRLWVDGAKAIKRYRGIPRERVGSHMEKNKEDDAKEKDYKAELELFKEQLFTDKGVGISDLIENRMKSFAKTNPTNVDKDVIEKVIGDLYVVEEEKKDIPEAREELAKEINSVAVLAERVGDLEQLARNPKLRILADIAIMSDQDIRNLYNKTAAENAKADNTISWTDRKGIENVINYKLNKQTIGAQIEYILKANGLNILPPELRDSQIKEFVKKGFAPIRQDILAIEAAPKPLSIKEALEKGKKGMAMAKSRHEGQLAAAATKEKLLGQIRPVYDNLKGIYYSEANQLIDKFYGMYSHIRLELVGKYFAPYIPDIETSYFSKIEALKGIAENMGFLTGDEINGAYEWYERYFLRGLELLQDKFDGLQENYRELGVGRKKENLGNQSLESIHREISKLRKGEELIEGDYFFEAANEVRGEIEEKEVKNNIFERIRSSIKKLCHTVMEIRNTEDIIVNKFGGSIGEELKSFDELIYERINTAYIPDIFRPLIEEVNNEIEHEMIENENKQAEMKARQAQYQWPYPHLSHIAQEQAEDRRNAMAEDRNNAMAEDRRNAMAEEKLGFGGDWAIGHEGIWEAEQERQKKELQKEHDEYMRMMEEKEGGHGIKPRKAPVLKTRKPIKPRKKQIKGLKKRYKQDIPFGRYNLDMVSLGSGVVYMKYPCGVRVNAKKPISHKLQSIIKDLALTGDYDRDIYAALTASEKKYLEDILRKADVDHPLVGEHDYDKGMRKRANKDLKRFELLKGELRVGNNSPDILIELKDIIERLVEAGCIDPADVEGIV